MTDKTIEPPKTREEILAMSLEGREQEVMTYQINIDNYALALEEIGSLPPDERNDGHPLFRQNNHSSVARRNPRFQSSK